jgi:uncharacterized protein DUF6481
MPNSRTTRSPKPRTASLTDCRSAAAAAKRAMLERFRAKQDDPAMLERQAALKAISDARDARHAERKAARYQ